MYEYKLSGGRVSCTLILVANSAKGDGFYALEGSVYHGLFVELLIRHATVDQAGKTEDASGLVGSPGDGLSDRWTRGSSAGATDREL
jgi:hypothetical protein